MAQIKTRNSYKIFNKNFQQKTTIGDKKDCKQRRRKRIRARNKPAAEDYARSCKEIQRHPHHHHQQHINIEALLKRNGDKDSSFKPATTTATTTTTTSTIAVPPTLLPPPSPSPSSPSSSSRATLRFDFHLFPLVQFLWLLCCLSLANNSMADCPSLCECKWKSGKESVLCLNANLTHIPTPLDVGTQVLDLTGNDITNIPDDTFAAANLLNLQKIYFAKCRLRAIERYAFRKLINLVELDLSQNLLSSIPSLAFESIPELREIKLSGNPIYRVHDEAFIRVPQLVRLELSDCKLTTVEVRGFAGLESSLEWLKLDNNRLSEIRSGTITSLTALHGIELAGNLWNCSCALRPLRAWMLRQNIPYGIPPLCHAPERLAGKSWDKVDLDDFACVPQIIATDTTAHGVEGRNVTMSCYVEGVPEPSVRWMVKNRVIANLTGNGEPSDSPRTAAATQGRKTYVVNMLRNASNLTILTADMQDAGIYTCAAENKAGKVEASVTLAVSRRPPEAPLGAKIVLLCVLSALLFVVGSSFVAVCFCSLRRRRKMRLWNTVPPARTDSYEKIEMTTRSGGSGSGSGNGGGGTGSGSGESSNSGNNGGGGIKPDLGGGAGSLGFFHNDDGDYLRAATTPLNCSSDDGGDTGVAIVNPCGGSAKRNGDYRNIPTHCDDDEDNEYGNYHQQQQQQTAKHYAASKRWQNMETNHGKGVGGGSQQRSSPRQYDRLKRNNNGLAETSLMTTNGSGGGGSGAVAANGALDEPDLHIPRLIDIGSNPDSASSSISSQVDAATRLTTNNNANYTHLPSWHTKPIATTKIASPPTASKRTNSVSGCGNVVNNNGFYDDVSRSVYSTNNNNTEQELFDSNYPDLLDIAKYAVAQAKSQLNANQANAASSSAASGGSGGGALCTLPRKLKNTGKYFKNSSDSQSPLLADNSSKYGSSQLGDPSFLNELSTVTTTSATGRRFSAESTYSNYNQATYTAGQRSNSFLNLVHSSNKNSSLSMNIPPSAVANTAAGLAAAAASAARRNPSLPSSPVHELRGSSKQQLQLQQQQHLKQSIQAQLQAHQRSFSTAATPLLDFSSLTTRAGCVPTSSTAPSSSGVTPLLHPTTTTAAVTAYDYHAAQLERFLEEYRNLQDQLCKMKETCETIRKKEAPARVGLGQSAQLADPVMFNVAMAASSPPTNQKTTTLKSKALLPGQPPDPPPYWLHRNAMLKRLNETQQTPSDIFKS